MVLQMLYNRLHLWLALLMLVAWSQCALEEDFITDPGTRISFSTDTLSFDTVFTELGSATRSFKIYNPHDRPLLLESVRVASNTGGNFRINVDGISGEEVKDVYVPPNDSIYVFAEVTVNPDADISASPFILEGQVIVRAVDEEQSILLLAFGQNANYLPASRRRGILSLLTCELGTETLDDPKPYVLYGSLIVDSCTLVLPAGCRLYVHGGLVESDLGGPQQLYNDGILFFAGSGRLRIEGTAERPVLIASDRTEERFLERGGQYSGIRLLAGTGPHRIAHARIRNGVLGVFVDSAARLDIAHTEISYCSSNGIIAYAAEVNADNVAIHSTGSTGFEALKGGRYTLDYCTVVNFTGRNPAVQLSVGVAISQTEILRGPLNATIRNSLIYSSNEDALALPDAGEPALLTYAIDHSLIRTNKIFQNTPGFSERCNACVYTQPNDRLFVSIARDSFQLDSMSVALGQARPLQELPLDLLGLTRDAVMPDIGAYEFVSQ